jgi:hypothetical protein
MEAVQDVDKQITPLISKVPYFGRWPLLGVRPCVAFKAVTPLNAEAGGLAAGQDVLEGRSEEKCQR